MTPNHALQRTATAVTLAAPPPSPAQPSRQPPPSLSLGSLGVMRTSLEKISRLVLATVLFVGCREHQEPRPSSVSIKQARSRGVFIAEYAVPAIADLADCRLIEVWVETSSSERWEGQQEIIVRLDARHHGGAPRVRIAGIDEMQYHGMWSEPNGPPYERWAAPSPLPAKLQLERKGKTVEIERKTQ